MPDRPYILLSCGMSIDGYLGAATPRRLELSNDADFDRVDAVRASCDAILVGAATVRTDNPRLLVRSQNRRDERAARGLPTSPIKVTVTERLRARPQRRLLHHGRQREARVLHQPPRRRRPLAVGRGGHGRRRRPARADAQAHRGSRRPRRAAADGRGRGHGPHPVSDRRPRRRTAAVVAPVFVGDSRATRFVGDGRYPWNPGRRATLADVRQIGDVVLLRYALSPRFQD